MSNQKWIIFQGMVTVEQAEYLAGVLSVGNDPDGLAGSRQETALVDDIENKLRTAIGHIKDQGCSGSGIVVTGNEFLETEDEADAAAVELCTLDDALEIEGDAS